MRMKLETSTMFPQHDTLKRTALPSSGPVAQPAQSEGLLPPRFWVRIPAGSPNYFR